VIEGKWFGEKIDRAGLHRLHRGLDTSECSHDYDRHVRILPAEILQQLQTVDTGQTEIGQDQVRTIRQLERIFGASCLFDVVSGGL